MASNAVPPSVTPPSPFEWPQTIKTITNVTNDSQAMVTCPTHGFTSADVGQTFVMFLQVKGMLPINGATGLIQQIIDINNFTVNVYENVEKTTNGLLCTGTGSAGTINLVSTSAIVGGSSVSSGVSGTVVKNATD